MTIRSALHLAALSLTLFLALLFVSLPSELRAEASAPSSKASPEELEVYRKLLERLNAQLFESRYLGIPTLQNPLDVWVTQEILFEQKPDFVVEAGTFRGGSALLWATLLAPIVPDARVITIDIEDRRLEAAKSHPLARTRVEFLLGSSTSPRIVADVARRVKGKRVVVILDSLHTAEHVFAELEAYAPLIRKGGYLIVQDTLAGPTEGIQRFLEKHPEFEIDRTRERFGITNNLGGYLKRVR